MGTDPVGQAPDRVVGDGRSAGGHLERVLLAGEDVQAHVDAGGPGPLGERASSSSVSASETWRNRGGRPATSAKRALEHGLLDELRLWVHPLIVGSGSPSDLLFGTAPAVGFRLTDAITLNDGITILSYETDEKLAKAA